VSTAIAAPTQLDPTLLETYFFEGRRRPPCLLIHGFTGTPYETRALGEHLHREGHAVLGVRLAGHATDLETLEATGWRDWFSTVSAGCDRLRATHGPVAAVGLSAGALLALHLAHERPRDVVGLGLMAVALTLGDWRPRLGAPVLARIPWLRRRFRFIPKAGGSDIRDAAARGVHPGSAAVPLAALVSLLELQRIVGRELPAITHPSILVHGGLDRTAPPANAEVVRRRLGRPPERVLILERSAHVVTVDCEREQVADAIAAFVGGLGAHAS
jgi:carboxylesterase